MNRQRETSPRKQYVKVRADHYCDGRIIPLKFRPEDGDAVVIDRILDIRLAPSLKAGGQGLRYTCRCGERVVYLFHDREVWFVEEDNGGQ